MDRGALWRGRAACVRIKKEQEVGNIGRNFELVCLEVKGANISGDEAADVDDR